MRPLILISNDDGYRSKGLRSLVEMVHGLADLLVVAPESARSGYSCAFSAAEPLKLEQRGKEQGVEIWSCSGTPVDCIKIALDRLCRDRWPNMVVGGINHGDNGSVNSHYSGTMGLTLEGCMKYIPSVAFSLCDHSDDADFSAMTGIVQAITADVLAHGLPRGVCLNVNFPARDHYEGIKVCRMAHGTWYNEVDARHHPRGYDYYWMVGEYRNDEPEAEDTDNYALTHGYVAITPTTIDVTAHEYIGELKSRLRVNECNESSLSDCQAGADLTK